MNDGSSFKTAKANKVKSTAGSSHNWNTLFLGQSVVADILANKLGKTKQVTYYPSFKSHSMSNQPNVIFFVSSENNFWNFKTKLSFLLIFYYNLQNAFLKFTIEICVHPSNRSIFNCAFKIIFRMCFLQMVISPLQFV